MLGTPTFIRYSESEYQTKFTQHETASSPFIRINKIKHNYFILIDLTSDSHFGPLLFDWFLL